MEKSTFEALLWEEPCLLLTSHGKKPRMKDKHPPTLRFPFTGFQNSKSPFSDNFYFEWDHLISLSQGQISLI